MRSLTRRFRGALLLALVVTAAAVAKPDGALAGGGCRGEKSTEATGSVVEMKETCFVPTVLHANAGEAVTFRNASDLPHSVAGATLEWGNYTEQQPGQSVTVTFAKPGVYPYYCFVHNGMIGAIDVGGSADASATTRVEAQVRSQAAATVAVAPPAAGTGSAGGGKAWDATPVVRAGLGATLVGAGLLFLVVRKRRT